jgi:ribonucleotide monophosphatase NagD (HAD superfamily)
MVLEPEKIKISPMPKTWILDLDGTIVVHDGPYFLGHDEFLPGAREFLKSIPDTDIIIFLTARSDYEKEHTLRFLKENKVKYDHIIFNAGQGERIMINDMKPDGLVTAYAVNTTRDRFCQTKFITDRTMGTRFD